MQMRSWKQDREKHSAAKLEAKSFRAFSFLAKKKKEINKK